MLCDGKLGVSVSTRGRLLSEPSLESKAWGSQSSLFNLLAQGALEKSGKPFRTDVFAANENPPSSSTGSLHMGKEWEMMHKEKKARKESKCQFNPKV